MPDNDILTPTIRAVVIRRAAQRLGELTGAEYWIDLAAALDGIRDDEDAEERLARLFG